MSPESDCSEREGGRATAIDSAQARWRLAMRGALGGGQIALTSDAGHQERSVLRMQQVVTAASSAASDGAVAGRSGSNRPRVLQSHSKDSAYNI